MIQRKLEPYEIYCDGSCKGNGAKLALGAWAYCILFDNSLVRKDCGGIPQTTNQRMELTAALEAIKGVLELTKYSKGNTYNIYSDSAYLINCYSQGWYIGWEQNGGRNAAKQEVKNQDLWIQLLPFFKNRDFHFFKVKGHFTNYYNNFVDKMAQDAAKQFEKKGLSYGGTPIWEIEELKQYVQS